VSHLPRLKAHQLVLLRRVADGQPVTSAESTLVTSAYALRNRNSVTTPRSKGVWTAVITDAGRYYLQHAATQLPDRWRPFPAIQPSPSATEHGPGTSTAAVDGEWLLARLMAEDSPVTIPDPSPAVRRVASSHISRDHRRPSPGRAADRSHRAVQGRPGHPARTLDPPDRPKPAPVPVPETAPPSPPGDCCHPPRP